MGTFDIILKKWCDFLGDFLEVIWFLGVIFLGGGFGAIFLRFLDVIFWVFRCDFLGVLGMIFWEIF